MDIVECPTDECLSILVTKRNHDLAMIRFCNTVGKCDVPNFGFTNSTIIDCRVCEGDLCNSREIMMDNDFELDAITTQISKSRGGGGGGGGESNNGTKIELFYISRINMILIIFILNAAVHNECL